MSGATPGAAPIARLPRGPALSGLLFVENANGHLTLTDDPAGDPLRVLPSGNLAPSDDTDLTAVRMFAVGSRFGVRT